MSEYLVDIKNERLSFFTPAGEVKALNDVSIHLKEEKFLVSLEKAVLVNP